MYLPSSGSYSQRREILTVICIDRTRLIEILNNGGFEPPMIVFVNQKKGADVLQKELQRARVSFISPFLSSLQTVLIPPFLVALLVEFYDSTLGQEPRTTRSRTQLDPHGRKRCTRSNGSSRTRYRCTKRFLGRQLPNVEYDRSVHS